MGTASTGLNLSGPPKAGKVPSGGNLEVAKTAFLILAVVGVVYLFYDSYQFRAAHEAEIAKLVATPPVAPAGSTPSEATSSTWLRVIAVGSHRRDSPSSCRYVGTTW